MPLFRGVNTIDAERLKPPHAQQETIAHYKFTKTPGMQRAVAVSGNFKYYVVKNTRVRVLDAASPAKGLTSWPQEDVVDLEVAPPAVCSSLLGSGTQDALAMATNARVVVWAVAPATAGAPDKVVLAPLFDLNAAGVLGVRWHPAHPVLLVLRSSGVLAVHLAALRAASGTQQCLSADLDVSLRASARWCSAVPLPQGSRLTAVGITCTAAQCFLTLGTAQGGAYLACSQDDTEDAGSSFALFAVLQAPASSAPVAVCGTVPFAASGSLLALVALHGGATWRAFEVPLRTPSKPLPLHQPMQVVALPAAPGSGTHGCGAAVLPCSGAAVAVHRDGTVHILQAAANTPVLCRLYSASVAASAIASLAPGAAAVAGEAPLAPPDARETLFLVSDDDVTRVRVPLPPAPTVAVQAARSPPVSPADDAPPAAAGRGTAPGAASTAAAAVGAAASGGSSPAPDMPAVRRPVSHHSSGQLEVEGEADVPALLRSLSRLQAQVDAMPAALHGGVLRAAQVAAAAATEGTADAFKDSTASVAGEVQAALAPVLAALDASRRQQTVLAEQLAELKAGMLSPEQLESTVVSRVKPAIAAAVQQAVAAAVPKAVATALAGHSDEARDAVRSATAHAFRNASTSLNNATQRCIAEQLQATLPGAVHAAVAEAMQHLPRAQQAPVPEPLPCNGVVPPTDEALRTKLLRLAAAAEYSASIYETAFTMALEAQAGGVLQWLCCSLAGEGAQPEAVLGSVSPVVAVCVMQQLTQGLRADAHADTRTILQWLLAAVKCTTDVASAGAGVQDVVTQVHAALRELLQRFREALRAAVAAGQAGVEDTQLAVQELQQAL